MRGGTRDRPSFQRMGNIEVTEMEETNKLTVIERQDPLAIFRNPEIVLQEAKRAAKALTDVITSKPNKVIFNNVQFLEFEDWQTVARFYGVTVKVASTAYVEMGSAKGFESRAVVLRSDGVEISAADSMCLDDEEKWSARPKYAWSFITKDGELVDEFPGKERVIWEKDSNGKMRPKKKRHQIGTEAVPMFQLRSMAQTRACAKALRNVFSWVVVLAGYSPTTAEEISPGSSHTRFVDESEQPLPDTPGEKTVAELEMDLKETIEHECFTEDERNKVKALLKKKPSYKLIQDQLTKCLKRIEAAEAEIAKNNLAAESEKQPAEKAS